VLASAQKRRELGAFGLAQLDSIAYVHSCLLVIRGTDEQLNRMADVSRATKNFTPKQGQYLAYIHLYLRLHRRPPAETVNCWLIHKTCRSYFNPDSISQNHCAAVLVRSYDFKLTMYVERIPNRNLPGRNLAARELSRG
jgi:hypothetical protein